MGKPPLSAPACPGLCGPLGGRSQGGMWAGTQRDRRVTELAGGSDTGGGRACPACPALRRVCCSRRPLCRCRLNPVLASSARVAAAAASEDRHTAWPRPPRSEGLTCWAPAEARRAGPHSHGPETAGRAWRPPLRTNGCCCFAARGPRSHCSPRRGGPWGPSFALSCPLSQPLTANVFLSGKRQFRVKPLPSCRWASNRSDHVLTPKVQAQPGIWETGVASPTGRSFSGAGRGGARLDTSAVTVSKSKRVWFQVLPVPAGNRPSDGGAVSHQEAAAAGSPVPDFQQGRVLHQRQPARVFRAVPSRAVPTTRVRRRVSAHNGDVGLGATAHPAPPWPVRSVGTCGPRFRGFLPAPR